MYASMHFLEHPPTLHHPSISSVIQQTRDRVESWCYIEIVWLFQHSSYLQSSISLLQTTMHWSRYFLSNKAFLKKDHLPWCIFQPLIYACHVPGLPIAHTLHSSTNVLKSIRIKIVICLLGIVYFIHKSYLQT